MTKFIEDVVLTGEHVVLEPMSLQHIDDLSCAVQDGELWKLWYTLVPQPPHKMEEWVNIALEAKNKLNQMPFIVRKIDNGINGPIIGSTRFLNVYPEHRRVEIGSTWYAASYQKTAVNTECKLLLLTHAFEKLNCVVVEFKTHYMNTKSRNAILRLGAKQDGILRNHMIMPDGTYRDTVAFSIIESEWPSVKVNLLNKLGRL